MRPFRFGQKRGQDLTALKSDQSINNALPAMLSSTYKPPTNSVVTNMNDKSAWRKKIPARIYDYNYKVAEGYYQSQTDYINNKPNLRENPEPPKHQTYAERFSYKPWYGGVSGLPYDETISALSKPLLKPSQRQRGSSLVREIKELEEDNIPLHIRASRRRKKFEEEERQKGVRPKLGRATSLTDAPINKLNDVRREMYKLNDGMLRSADYSNSKSTISYNNSYGKNSLTNSTSGTTVIQDDRKYQMPGINSTHNKSYSSSQSSVSHKPPSLPSHKTSNGVSSKKYVDSVFKPWPRRRASFSGDEIPSALYNRAEKHREVKRSQESKDVTSNINSMVDKMRVGKLDENAAYSFATNLRSTSVEGPSRGNSRKGRMIYGIAK